MTVKEIPDNELKSKKYDSFRSVSDSDLPYLQHRTLSGIIVDFRSLDLLEGADFSALRKWGKHKNVLLTLEQYLCIQLATTAPDYYIETLSNYLVSHPESVYYNHYGLIKNSIRNKIGCKGNKDPLGKLLPDPEASYDILYYELCAKYKKPRVIKRKNRPGGYPDRRWDKLSEADA